MKMHRKVKSEVKKTKFDDDPEVSESLSSMSEEDIDMLMNNSE